MMMRTGEEKEVSSRIMFALALSAFYPFDLIKIFFTLKDKY